MAWFKTLRKEKYSEASRARSSGISVFSDADYPEHLVRDRKHSDSKDKQVAIMGYEETVRAARKHDVECSPVFVESINERLVMTSYTETIRMYESNGKRLESIHAESPKSMLSGIAVNANCNSMYVCDAIGDDDSRVQIFNIAQEITPVVYLGQGLFKAPHGICVTPDHKILVTDVEKNEVYIIQEDGYNALCFGERGKRPGQFLFPHDVVFDDEHKRIIVSDTHNHRIQVFTAEGQFLKVVEFDKQGKRLFNFPTGLKIDPLGNLIVCQNGSDILSILDPDLRPYHTLATNAMGIQKPTAVALLPYERLCMASSEGSCYVIF